MSRAQAALVQAGSYRDDHPLEPEPAPYVGEARCQKCHAADLSDLAGQPSHPELSIVERSSTGSRGRSTLCLTPTTQK